MQCVNFSVMIHCNSYEASTRAKRFCALTTTESRAKVWYQYIAFKPPVAEVVVCCKSVVLLLLIHWLLLLPLFVGVLRLVLVLLFSILCPRVAKTLQTYLYLHYKY